MDTTIRTPLTRDKPNILKIRFIYKTGHDIFL